MLIASNVVKDYGHGPVPARVSGWPPAHHRGAVNNRYRPDTHRGCPLVNDGHSVAVIAARVGLTAA